MDPEDFGRLMEQWEKKRSLTVGQIYFLAFATLVLTLVSAALGLFFIGLFYGGTSALPQAFVITFTAGAFSAVFACLGTLVLAEKMRSGNVRGRAAGGGESDEEDDPV